jgi:hypothetical protein
MSALQDRLDHIKAGFLAKSAPEVGTIITRATEELRDSGIMDRLPAVGDLAPPFELPDTDGRVVRSADLLERGPLIVSFYRGVW